ncbi:MAG: DUF1801 domain-containing protein [Fimbriimonadaceae bacterium]|nr:DUF1801 domain-containing protein [Fimbriimonadaceae bacterium]
MVIKAASFDEYLVQIPPERQAAFVRLREVINNNIDPRFEEGMQYNFPSWFVPHSIYPQGYHCDHKQPLPFISIGNQKNFIAFYGCFLYNDDGQRDWFIDQYKKTGLKLDMGKSCVRFKKHDAIPFELIGESVARVSLEEFIATYEKHRM